MRIVAAGHLRGAFRAARWHVSLAFMSAAAFITCGLAWLITAMLIALRLAGTGPARRVRQPLPTLLAGWLTMTAVLLVQYSGDRDWPLGDRRPIDLTTMVLAAAFLAPVLRDAGRRSRGLRTAAAPRRRCRASRHSPASRT